MALKFFPTIRHSFLCFCRYTRCKRYFIYLFTTLFNVGQTIVTRLIKTNLAKTNTDIINKNFKIFDMQHKNSESFCIWFNFCLNFLTEALFFNFSWRIIPDYSIVLCNRAIFKLVADC